MKNCIANETLGIATSDYIRGQLLACIKRGRDGRGGNEEAWKEALIHLGGALHTLEDFAAHSNYT